MSTDLYQKYVDDPRLLLRDIDQQLEQAAMEDLPLLPLDGDKPVEREVRDGRPTHTVVELLLNRSKQAVTQACCVRLGYCSMRRRHGDTVQLIQAVADGLLSAYVKFPIPVGTVASYCVLSLFLDRLCECHAGPEHPDREA